MTTTPNIPELREEIARHLAAGDTGSGAHWGHMSESLQEMFRRYADHALMAVQPELDRLRAEVAQLRDQRTVFAQRHHAIAAAHDHVCRLLGIDDDADAQQAARELRAELDQLRAQHTTGEAEKREGIA